MGSLERPKYLDKRKLGWIPLYWIFRQLHIVKVLKQALRELEPIQGIYTFLRMSTDKKRKKHSSV